jgi:predicted ATPase
MRLRSLVIKNFRGLESIEVEFDNLVNVIVGPNAIGKTTVLEAIRLTKALLAPRTQQESQNALVSLGAAVPYLPQRIFPEAIARDVSRPIEISCEYLLNDGEIAELSKNLPQVAMQATLSSAGLAFGNPGNSISLLSSPQGQTFANQIEGALKAWLDELSTKKRGCILGFKMHPRSGRVEQTDQNSAFAIAFLDQHLRPNLTRFSYFSADRSLPLGEPPVQVGGADATHQLEAHMSNPQSKYSRLKNTIFNAVVSGAKQREELEKEFNRIFDGPLKGREFLRVGVNDRGLLSIRVRDTETSREFDLDAMSSGEKGLVLTFLLIGQSIVNGGLILLDEPELHLNPAVCKSLLTFLVDTYAVPKQLQAIVCSHSPELLAGALENSMCSLYHLKSETVLTKVRRKDESEIAQILQRLGSSESEALLYKATVFVEGDDDVDLLDAGYGELLRSYKLRDLGGRREVEKQIVRLQQIEKTDDTLQPQYFVFDRDESATRLTSSAKVRVLQWNKRCLENYLLDLNVLTDFLQKPEIAERPISSLGEVKNALRELAMSQLDELVAKQVYADYCFEGSGLRANEIKNKSFEEMADILFSHIGKVQAQVGVLTSEWKEQFIAKCQSKKRELRELWDVRWEDDCDGKRLFRDLHSRVRLRMSVAKFKRLVMVELRTQRTDSWLSVESQIKSFLA